MPAAAGLRAALLKGAHERGINTAIETACNVPWKFVEKVLPHVDTMLHDHKLTIPERHKKWTGVSNERILANFKKAYETFPDIDFIARTPLIPGINADEEHIRAVLAFIRPHKNVIDYELLPYHRFGLGKYLSLGVVYELDDYKTPSDDLVKHLQAIIDEAFGRTRRRDDEHRHEDIYERLANALEALPHGFARTPSGVEIKLIKMAFTPEEVWLAGHLTRIPETAAEIAKRVGRDVAEVTATLESLIPRRLVRLDSPGHVGARPGAHGRGREEVPAGPVPGGLVRGQHAAAWTRSSPSSSSSS